MYNNNELKHYGVLGMKWGVRRYQNKNGTLTSAGKKKYSNDKSNDKKHFTDKQKKAIKIGAAAAATAIIAIGGYHLYKNGKLDGLVNLGKNKVGDADVIQKNNVLKKLSKQETLHDTLSKANPLKGTVEGRNNCSVCGITGFLRQHGYDVVAKSTGGKMQNLGGVIDNCFKNAKILEGSATKFGKSRNDAADMLLKKYGPNAEGVCGIQWIGGGGHAFNWRIKDGIVEFFDSQQGRGDDLVSGYFNKIDQNGALTLARLDNLQINMDSIFEYVRNR